MEAATILKNRCFMFHDFNFIVYPWIHLGSKLVKGFLFIFFITSCQLKCKNIERKKTGPKVACIAPEETKEVGTKLLQIYFRHT